MSGLAQDISPTAAPQSEDQRVSPIESPSDGHQSLEKKSTNENEEELRRANIADRKKANGGLGAVALIFACGTALFSDGERSTGKPIYSADQMSSLQVMSMQAVAL
jgi:hypothetical protein